jgi:hypothetical protein
MTRSAYDLTFNIGEPIAELRAQVHSVRVMALALEPAERSAFEQTGVAKQPVEV